MIRYFDHLSNKLLIVWSLNLLLGFILDIERKDQNV